jgi:hypothetical protein
VITDGQISQDSCILGEYDKVILLHNEYVTNAEYYAITHHKKVVYLYPNAPPYAEVKYEPANSTITLIRGHGYPDKDTGNGLVGNLITHRRSITEIAMIGPSTNWKMAFN